jgi:putative ABC transport system substrate-binding protein
MVPNAATIAVLLNPNFLNAKSTSEQVQRAASSLGLHIVLLNASSEHEIDQSFTTLVENGARALLVFSDPFFYAKRDQIITLAARHAVPAIYMLAQFVKGGGLMSYGANLVEWSRPVGVYVGRILKGAKPADLPVQLPTRFELAINLKTAKALGLEVPWFLQQRADDVIE